MRTQHHFRRVRGFTLIEIMIVIAVLGALAAIVTPQFTMASQEAMTSSVLADLQTVRRQIQLYDLDNAPWSFDPLDAVQNPNNWDELIAGAWIMKPPKNPLQDGDSGVAAAPAAGVGWTWSDPNGWGVVGIYAVDETGVDFDLDADGLAD